MLKIYKEDNALVVEGLDNGQFPDNGQLSFPLNSISVVIDESEMATFRSASNNDVLFSGLIDNITINGESVTKDNIIEKFDAISNAAASGGGGGMTPEERQELKQLRSDVEDVMGEVATLEADKQNFNTVEYYETNENKRPDYPVGYLYAPKVRTTNVLNDLSALFNVANQDRITPEISWETGGEITLGIFSTSFGSTTGTTAFSYEDGLITFYIGVMYNRMTVALYKNNILNAEIRINGEVVKESGNVPETIVFKPGDIVRTSINLSFNTVSQPFYKVWNQHIIGDITYISNEYPSSRFFYKTDSGWIYTFANSQQIEGLQNQLNNKLEASVLEGGFTDMPDLDFSTEYSLNHPVFLGIKIWNEEEGDWFDLRRKQIYVSNILRELRITTDEVREFHLETEERVLFNIVIGGLENISDFQDVEELASMTYFKIGRRGFYAGVCRKRNEDNKSFVVIPEGILSVATGSSSGGGSGVTTYNIVSSQIANGASSYKQLGEGSFGAEITDADELYELVGKVTLKPGDIINVANNEQNRGKGNVNLVYYKGDTSFPGCHTFLYNFNKIFDARPSYIIVNYWPVSKLQHLEKIVACSNYKVFGEIPSYGANTATLGLLTETEYNRIKEAINNAGGGNGPVVHKYNGSIIAYQNNTYGTWNKIGNNNNTGYLKYTLSNSALDISEPLNVGDIIVDNNGMSVMLVEKLVNDSSISHVFIGRFMMGVGYAKGDLQFVIEYNPRNNSVSQIFLTRLYIKAIDESFTDLETIAYPITQKAYDAKQDALVSGTNIKTVNGESILGEGDITIEGGASLPAGNYLATFEQNGGSITFAQRGFDGKSSTEKTVDFKTINGQSIFGQGDLKIEGGGATDVPTVQEGSSGTEKNYIYSVGGNSDGKQVLSRIDFRRTSGNLYLDYYVWGYKNLWNNLTVPKADQNNAGVMSAADKTKLDSLANEWTGTLEEYKALGTYDDNTNYYIIEEE